MVANTLGVVDHLGDQGFQLNIMVVPTTAVRIVEFLIKTQPAQLQRQIPIRIANKCRTAAFKRDERQDQLMELLAS